ncbi:MAG: acyl-CoA dehydratase activase, partial [Planctomycetota bacterium]
MSDRFPPGCNAGDCFLGIDIGSVSLNLAVVDADGAVLDTTYERTSGEPLPRLLAALRRLRGTVAEVAVCGTGSGRPLLAEALSLPVENEIVAHAWGAVDAHPTARTVMEIGGQDSKLILLGEPDRDGGPRIEDHAMNEVCAAGTGAFLDQQAARLGVAIEGEFGELALRSERPAPIAGRCSVFAKSDMIHLQQEGYPREDIIAGLCYALARSYLSNLSRGRALPQPILFQGGVAANQGVVRAFEDLLGLGPQALIIPDHYAVIGAIGAALIARAERPEPVALDDVVARLEACLARPCPRTSASRPLRPSQASVPAPPQPAPRGAESLYLGIDVGSVSTSIVLLDDAGGLHHELYLYTQGDPVGAVRHGLGALGEALGTPPRVAAVGVTGSGRYLIGELVGADLVINEITAQARAAVGIDPQVDTVFEIGGQDSKFIRLRDGAVVDFAMNKVCAAGTGAFLEEQAERVGVAIDEEFSRLAFQAEAPVDLGSRCTVFMDTDLVHHQQQGAAKADLVAGLAYAVARNYLEKVVGHRPVGERVLCQGGVASNRSVVAAFEALLGRPVAVPAHHRATGAIGAAVLAREAATEGQDSRFRGFELSQRSFRTESFQCTDCPNRCDIKRVVLDGRSTAHYGSTCGKYEARGGRAAGPDLFAERERLLLDGWLPDGPRPDAPVVGIPRILLFHDFFPEWCAFFQTLGYRVVLSDPTHRHIIHQSLEHVVVENCFPIKISYGHVADLLLKGARRVFLPAIVEARRPEDGRKHYMCPFVQNIPAFVRSAFPHLDLLSPVFTCAGRQSNWREALTALGHDLGHPPQAVQEALDAARRAQDTFEREKTKLGREVLANLGPDQDAVVVFGRPYNTCDRALSMQVARKLRQRGALAIPLDLLPLDTEPVDGAWEDVVWRIGQHFVAGAKLVRRDARLHPLVITNFSCGLDSMLLATVIDHFFADRPLLVLEVDEHFADAGVVTRCEAFLHEIRERRQPVETDPMEARPVHVLTRRHRRMTRTLYVPTDSEQFYAVWGAFRSMGIDARLLPRPDRHTEELGRRHTLSRGCLPFVHFAGDAVRMTEEPDFEPAQSAFVIPGNDESCRVNQFPRALRQILDRLGAQ